MKIGILGTGAYGIALAKVFYENNCEVSMWTKFENEEKEINKFRENKKVLPGIKIPKDIKVTTNMEEVATGKNLIVIALPAQSIGSVFEKLKKYINKNDHICLASKGIEQGTCSFVYDILKRYIKTKNIAVISGPSFAVDIVNEAPIGLTLACKNKKTEVIVISSMQNKRVKLRTTKDIIGTELCGAIKNVIAIAAGMIEGMGYPESTQAMFITESLNDIKNLIYALGGNKKTILSFAGFGDLLLTATSQKSRNFKFGYVIGKKSSKKEIEEYKKSTTIEGLYTLKSIHKLLKNKKVKMPVINLIYDIIYKGKDPNELITFLVKKE